jgi:hypothetical protein
VSDQIDKKEIAELRELNQELTESLRRCRAILHDCRDRLAANSNEEDQRKDENDQSQSG